MPQLNDDPAVVLVERKRYCQQEILENMCYCDLSSLEGMKAAAIAVEEEQRRRDCWKRGQEKGIDQVFVELEERRAGAC